MTPELWKLVIVLVFALLVIGFAMSLALQMRNANLDVLKRAIDRGQTLDPKMVSTLLGRHDFDPRSLLFPGIMNIAIAVGLAAMSLILERPKVLAGGAILLCIGLALVLSAKFLPRPSNDAQA